MIWGGGRWPAAQDSGGWHRRSVGSSPLGLEGRESQQRLGRGRGREQWISTFNGVSVC